LGVKEIRFFSCDNLSGVRKQDERRWSPLANLSRQRDAIHSQHLEIDQNHVKRLFRHFPQTFRAAGTGGRLHSPDFQLSFQDAPIGGVVVDDENIMGSQETGPG
jgi:hypothetical protein